MSSESTPAFMPGFDPQRFMSLWSRAFQGPEQAMRVYRKLLGLKGDSRERAVDFMAQFGRGYRVDATPSSRACSADLLPDEASSPVRAAAQPATLTWFSAMLTCTAGTSSCGTWASERIAVR